MSEDEGSIESQVTVFKALASEIRLQLLRSIAEDGPASAPELESEVPITPESVKNNLDKLEQAGLLESKRVHGPGNRPRDEFSLANGGFELHLAVESGSYAYSED